MAFPKPRPVRPGSRIAVVAPAGPFDVEAFSSGLNWLAERYEAVHRPDIFAKSGYLAGDDTRRLGELREAIGDPSVDAIVCARGGFGTTRILPGIDDDLVRRANKLVIGFSDITCLHLMLWRHCGLVSIHGALMPDAEMTEHQPNERVDLAALYQAMEIYAHAVYSLTR